MHAIRRGSSWALALGLLLAPLTVHAAAQRVNMINGIGLLDYSRKPDLKVGQWIKYHMTGSSELGMHDDYTVTILIAGEETFWGERGFWVETWTEGKDEAPVAVATLMSYGIFSDSLPIPHLQLYSRKMITNLSEDGSPVEVISKRNAGSLKGRSEVADKVVWHVDSVGTETIKVPRGTYACKKVSFKQGIGSTADVGDSTIRTEVHEDRMVYMSPQVPMTGLVREDVSNLIQRRVWKAGNSQNAPLRTMEHATGTAELIEWGMGLTPQLVPAKYRRKVAERETPAKTAPARTASRRRG